MSWLWLRPSIFCPWLSCQICASVSLFGQSEKSLQIQHNQNNRLIILPNQPSLLTFPDICPHDVSVQSLSCILLLVLNLRFKCPSGRSEVVFLTCPSASTSTVRMSRSPFPMNSEGISAALFLSISEPVSINLNREADIVWKSVHNSEFLVT